MANLTLSCKMAPKALDRVPCSGYECGRQRISTIVSNSSYECVDFHGSEQVLKSSEKPQTSSPDEHGFLADAKWSPYSGRSTKSWERKLLGKIPEH